VRRPLKVLICSYLDPDLAAEIGSHPGVDLLYAPDVLPVPRYPCDHHGPARRLDARQEAEWQSRLRSAEACFDFDWQDPAGMPARAPNVSWLQATSSGIGQFMQRTGLDTWAAAVTTAAGIHSRPLTEWAVTGILHFVKDVPDLQDRQAAHRWERMAMGGLAGRRALVVGLGHVGRSIAAALAALGVEVWAAGRPGHVRQAPGVSRTGSTAELDSLLPPCDIVVLTCPLTPDTAGLIGGAQLKALGPDGILVNVSRGQVVDEDALIEALTNRSIRGAVLDVVTTEPLPEASPLWALPNALISPHSASTLTTENAALVRLFLQNMTRLLAGEQLINQYDPAKGY
jgi:glyoxylate/hydroxypyruvate reductase A